MILGITGWVASGKDTVGDYLAENYGFRRFSLSDALRDDLNKDRIELTRDNLRERGNVLREKFGPAILAEKAAETIKSDPDRNWVLLSIRLPSEVAYLRENCDLLLISVDVPEKIRYERALNRAKVGEKIISFDDFIAKETAERGGQNNSQAVDQVINMADISIENSGTVDDLYQKIDKIIEKIK